MGGDLGAIMEHYCEAALVNRVTIVSSCFDLRITRMQKIASAEMCKSIVLYLLVGL
jgi:hypothetical protein